MEHIAGTWYDEWLTAVMKKNAIKQSILDQAMKINLPPRKRTEHKLREIGTPDSNMRVAMECVCEYIFEYYGLVPREYKNQERLTQVNMSEEHKDIINRWYLWVVDQKITEFMDTKYGDEYKREHWVPYEEDNSINIIEIQAPLETNLDEWPISRPIDTQIDNPFPQALIL